MSSSTLDFTVAIPTYNGATRLPEMLDRLRQQVEVESIRWEVIVVDNNSTDATRQVVEHYQTAWPVDVPLRYCFEPKQGAAFARLTAVREAQGEFIGFLDDDCWPAPNWVAAAVAFGQEYPRVGAFGGQIHGQFETPPPENFQRISSFLAIRERGDRPHLYQPDILSLPPAAAVVVRKQAWCETVPIHPMLGGKVNGSMLQGDDYEPLVYMSKAGWEVWYSPNLESYHQIPAWRLEKAYLFKLIRGSSLCLCYLRMIKPPAWQKPIVWLKVVLGSLARTVKYWLKYRKQLKTDLIAACELEFHLSSVLSPFYYLKTRFLVPRR